MSSVGGLSAYAADVVAVQRVFYDQRWSFTYQWLITMSTQLIGFSAGGIARRFLVAPPSMIWPSTLVWCAMFNTLHSQEVSGAGRRSGISRERFFAYACLGSFLWYFFPGYLFKSLSYLDWICWIVPKNVAANQLFGAVHGLGIFALTFDWGQIAYIGSPLATPWWAIANVATGFFLFWWIVVPIVYFTNTWNTKYFPISSRISYDHFGQPYNVTRVINPDATLNLEGYKKYSPLFLSATFAISYGTSFAGITCIIVHSILHFRKQIWMHARRSLAEQQDIHARLMARYKEVPDWWFAVVFVVTVAFGIIALQVWDTKLPIYAFVVCIVISFGYTIPIGMIAAITNRRLGLNVIFQLIVG
ncbi:hypothetical protein FRB99_004510, partial [Tulasnella sp. 403]